MRFALLFLALVTTAGCRPKAGAEQSGAPPRFGLAVSDSVGAWCAEFINDSTAPPLQSGQRLSIVFAGPAAKPAAAARLGAPHPGECPAAFPQPRWIDYVAYRVELLEPLAPDTLIPIVALIVASSASWTRGQDGALRADLDGDGTLEEARRCTADEGEHFTVWSVSPDGQSTRRWHEYYDWGAFTDPTCRPGEDGRDTAPKPT